MRSSSFKLGLIAFACFALGSVSDRLPEVTAQQPVAVHVAIIPVEMTDAKELVSKDLPGGKVVGISCLSKPVKLLPDAAVCYVATTP